MNHHSQKDIVRLTGKSQSYVSEIFSRKKRPSPEFAEDLERVTGIHRLKWLYPDEYDERGNRLPQSPEGATPC